MGNIESSLPQNGNSHFSYRMSLDGDLVRVLSLTESSNSDTLKEAAEALGHKISEFQHEPQLVFGLSIRRAQVYITQAELVPAYKKEGEPDIVSAIYERAFFDLQVASDQLPLLGAKANVRELQDLNATYNRILQQIPQEELTRFQALDSTPAEKIEGVPESEVEQAEVIPLRTERDLGHVALGLQAQPAVT